MDKHPVEKGIEDVVRTYDLLDRVRLGRDIVLRDDQFESEALLDAARLARGKRIGVGLIDTGRFEPSGLEWLIRERVRFYTSDEARPREDELTRLLKACRAARTFLAHFQNGPLVPGSGLAPDGLQRLVSAGMDLHLSNRVHARDLEALTGLAEGSRRGGGTFAYYHHGPLVPGLAELAARGAWLHVSDRTIGAGPGAGTDPALALARAARGAGSRLAVYVEAGLPVPVLEALFDTGAALLFQTPPSDDRSLLRPIERQAARRKLPVRAFYLSTAFLP